MQSENPGWPLGVVGGRPPKLEAEVVRKIGTAVAIGARPEQVARALGIGRSTFYDWVARGKAPGPGDHLYVELVETIEKARGGAYVSLIADLREVARRDPRAAMKLLEMNDREWAKAAGQAVSGEPSAAAPTIHVVIERKEPTGPRAVDPVAAEEAPSGGTVIDVSARLSAEAPAGGASR